MFSTKGIEESLTFLDDLIRSPLDLLPHRELTEKLIYLELQGPPKGLPNNITGALNDLASSCHEAAQNTSVRTLNLSRRKTYSMWRGLGVWRAVVGR